MTRRKNMTAGERQQAVEAKVEQHEAALQMLKMIVQQFGKNFNTIGNDVRDLAVKQRDIEYFVRALSELAGVNSADVIKRAEELQIADFTEASDKEDQEKGYTVAETVDEDSVVIISTEVVGGGAGSSKEGILRSKLKLSEITLPDFRSLLLGKKVGDVFEAKINDKIHKVTVVGVRSVPEPEANDEQSADLASNSSTATASTPVEEAVNNA